MSAPEASQTRKEESTLEGKAKKRIQQYIMFTEETYKTELCRSFQATRTCPYGLECRFAHGINELAPRIFEKNVFKTEQCLHFKKEGRCKFGTRCRYLHDEVRIQLNDKVTVLYSETEAILRGITHNDDGTISVQSHAYYPVFNLLQLFGDNDGFVKRGSMKNETYSSLMSEMTMPKKAATRRSPVTAEEVSVMINRLSLPQNEPGQWGNTRPKACQTFGDFTEELEQLNKRFEGRPHQAPRSPLPPRPETAVKPEPRFEEKPRSSSLVLWGQSERTPTSTQIPPVKSLTDSVSRRSPRPNPLSLPMSLSSKTHSLTGFGRETPPYEGFGSTPTGSTTPLNKNRFPWRDDPFPSHETNSSFSSPSSGFSSPPARERQESFSSTTFSPPSSYTRYDRPERNFGMSPIVNDPLRQPFRHFRANHDF